MENLISRKRRVQFDSPATEDSFPGGGHSRAARFLAQTILSVTRKPHVIGLEGKWGSGKSTVIESAANDLTSNDRRYIYRVFNLDLWSNQTSSFRRSFLEQLLSWLDVQDAAHLKFANCMRDKI